MPKTTPFTDSGLALGQRVVCLGVMSSINLASIERASLTLEGKKLSKFIVILCNQSHYKRRTNWFKPCYCWWSLSVYRFYICTNCRATSNFVASSSDKAKQSSPSTNPLRIAALVMARSIRSLISIWWLDILLSSMCLSWVIQLSRNCVFSLEKRE